MTDPLFGGAEDPNMAFILEAPPVKKMRHIYGKTRAPDLVLNDLLTLK